MTAPLSLGPEPYAAQHDLAEAEPGDVRAADPCGIHPHSMGEAPCRNPLNRNLARSTAIPEACQ